MTWRLPVVLVLVLILAFVWSAPPTVHVEGKVSVIACPGNPPKNPPPVTTECFTGPVAGATVLFAPMHGVVTTAVTVTGGRYRLEVPPGLYIVAAEESAPVRFSTQPLWVSIPAQPVLNMNIEATYLPI